MSSNRDLEFHLQLVQNMGVHSFACFQVFFYIVYLLAARYKV
jgi:hypothetical protein